MIYKYIKVDLTWITSEPASWNTPQEFVCVSDYTTLAEPEIYFPFGCVVHFNFSREGRLLSFKWF